MNVAPTTLALHVLADALKAAEADVCHVDEPSGLAVLDADEAARIVLHGPVSEIVQFDGRVLLTLEIPGPVHQSRDLDAGESEEAATGGHDPAPGGGTSELDARLIAVEDIYRRTLKVPGQWHAFLEGELRRHRASRLAELDLDQLLGVALRADQLARARGEARR